MATFQITDEERERRRQRALAMHSEPHPDDPDRRRLGGRQPNSGRKRQKRASEIIAERVAQEADLVASAIIDNLSDEQMPHIRLNAAKLAIDIEKQEAELQLREDRTLDGMDENGLMEMLIEAAMKGVAAGAFPVGDVIEGSAQEINGDEEG